MSDVERPEPSRAKLFDRSASETDEIGNGLGDYGSPKSDRSSSSRAQCIIKASLIVAFGWWGFGLYTVISTGSLAVLASLVDATIDLAAQGVLLGANRLAETQGVEASFPVGVSRLEPIGVIVCSTLMVVASGAVIYDCGYTLCTAFPGGPEMDFTLTAAVMLAAVVVVKIFVWRIAKVEYDRTNNVSLEALALDNFNDILSNASALLFAGLTCVKQETWWMDPVGGVLISSYIIRSWWLTATEQGSQLIGVKASEEFLSSVGELAESVENAELDLIRAYHFGPKCVVEVKLLMDIATPLQVSRDASITLQDQIERLDDCERCFVQIDYVHRDEDDHDTNVPLGRKTKLKGVGGGSGLKLRTVLSIGELARRRSWSQVSHGNGGGRRTRGWTWSDGIGVDPGRGRTWTG
jgi:cation diffusion facilitator family transporter